jgi:predicted DNA-binding transcriptional regulator AlpA
MTAEHHHPAQEDRLLPWRQVKELTGLSRTTAWRLQKAGDFPAPLVISPGRVGWRARDIAAWNGSRVPRGAAVPPASSSRTTSQDGPPHPLTPSPPRKHGSAPKPERAAPGGSPRRSKATQASQLRFDF